MGLKDLIAKTTTALIKPLFWVSKLLLYRPFVKLYYVIFRVRKYDLGQQSKRELINKKSFHVAALVLILLAFTLNLTDKKQASAAVGKTKKSVLAEIVKNEFSDTGQDNDELIQENALSISPQIMSAEKYLGRRGAITAPKGVSPSTDDNIVSTIAKTDNMLLKPMQIITSNGTVGAETATPTTRKEITYYTVESGDTISTIARRFRLNVNTILWANDLSAFSIIRAGDKLTILPADGFLYTVKRGDTIGKLAQNYELSTESIMTSNNLGSAGTIAIGQQLIIPGTKRTVASTRTIASNNSQSSYSGLAVIKDIVSSDKPLVGSNKMIWPTVGHRISQYFSWKHNGVDIANKVGTPLYAADSGVVELSQGGYNGGYGNTIVINHGGGKKTRYGHASKLLVKKGEEVVPTKLRPHQLV